MIASAASARPRLAGIVTVVVVAVIPSNLGPPVARADRPFTPSLTVLASTPAAAAHPQLTFTIRKTRDGTYDGYDEQDLRDVELILPPGLVMNLRAAPYCNLDGVTCASPGSQIGTGQIDGEVWIELLPGIRLPIDLPTLQATIHNEQPLQGEFARIVVVVAESVIGGFAVSSPATLDSATLAPVIKIEDLINTVTFEGATYPLSISGLSFSFDGTKGAEEGLWLVSNPTGCEPHSVEATFTSYGDDSVPSADDETITDGADYPVEGCNTLPYAPQVELSLGATTARASPTVRQVVTQAPGESATANMTLSMPAAFRMNPARAIAACSNDQIAARSCPEAARIAYVSLTTPLLDEPLTGASYMGPAVDDKVRIVTLLDGPVATTMEGTLWQRLDGGLDTISQDMPDIPIERIEYASGDGDQATFINPSTCGSHNASATFTGHSGKASTATLPLSIDGCVTALATVTRRLRASIVPRKPRRRARMHLTLSQDPAATIRRITYHIGGGLRWRLAGQPRRRALATVEVKPQEGATKIVDLYVASSTKKRLGLKSKSRRYPIAATISASRRREKVRVELSGLPEKPLYDVFVSIFGKRNKLLRTPVRCHKSALARATVTDGAGNRQGTSTTLSPGCARPSER